MAVEAWLVPVVSYSRYALEMMTGIVSTSSIIFRVRTGNDVTYLLFGCLMQMRATSRIAGCHPQQRSSIVRYTK